MPHWNQIGNDFNPPVELAPEEIEIQDKRTALLEQILALPKTPDAYGLVHLDLHLGNILLHADAPALTLLDFDDVALGWFVMDLVTPITDITICHASPEKGEIIFHLMSHTKPNSSMSTSRLECFRTKSSMVHISLGIFFQQRRRYEPWLVLFAPFQGMQNSPFRLSR